MNSKFVYLTDVGIQLIVPEGFGYMHSYMNRNHIIVTAKTYKFTNPNLRKIQKISNIILREYIFAMFILITMIGFSYLAVISLPYGGLGYMPGFLLGMIYLGVRFKLMDIFEKYI